MNEHDFCRWLRGTLAISIGIPLEPMDVDVIRTKLDAALAPTPPQPPSPNTYERLADMNRHFQIRQTTMDLDNGREPRFPSLVLG